MLIDSIRNIYSYIRERERKKRQTEKFSIRSLFLTLFLTLKKLNKQLIKY